MRKTQHEEKQGIFSEIVLNNIRRERHLLTKHACRSNKGTRKYPEKEKVPDRKNIRPVFFHDTDKIMHSSSYSRYIDKTQVFYLFENDHITHRVLHVQFVSKIGRVIGRCLKLNEDLIEAIALGHDLGHVPYGHDGERILHRLCQENNAGCFCHNAQSVRFLLEIERGGDGLNLALQTLDGILAHNGEYVEEKYIPNYSKTWAIFEEEYLNCLQRDNYSGTIIPMTLEGCVTRISDVIAYIGRDIEDAITLKLIKREMIPCEIKKILGDSNDSIINELVMDLIKNSYGKEYIAFSRAVFKALEKLKEFNYEHIYFNPKIKTQTHKIENMFRSLFKIYLEDVNNRNSDSAIFTYFLNDINTHYIENTSAARKVTDFLAGMTDDFFNNQYNQLFVPQSLGYEITSESGGKP